MVDLLPGSLVIFPLTTGLDGFSKSGVEALVFLLEAIHF